MKKYVIVISVTILWFVIIGLGTFRLMKYVAMRTPEDYSPLAPLLSVSDIGKIESYCDVIFPPSTKKILAYYKSVDRYHLYVFAEFDKSDIEDFKSRRSWIPSSDISKSSIESLTWPVCRVYMNTWSHGGGDCLTWWKPDPNDITCIHESAELSSNMRDEDTNTTILLAESGQTCCAYIVKSRYPDPPEEIVSVFPPEPNWDLRESPQYPKSKDP